MNEPPIMEEGGEEVDLPAPLNQRSFSIPSQPGEILLPTPGRSRASSMDQRSTISQQISDTDLDFLNSPSGRQSRATEAHRYLPTPLVLPDPHVAAPTPPLSATSDASYPKGNLIRRASRSALNASGRILRHRQSLTSMADRDNGPGPLLVRRRSASRATQDSEYSGTVPSPDPYVNDLRMVPNTAQTLSLAALSLATPMLPPADVDEPPVVSDLLRYGTKLYKFTKTKRKELKFSLDPIAARVSWRSKSGNIKRMYIDNIQSIKVQAAARRWREDLGVPSDVEKFWISVTYTATGTRAKGGNYTKYLHVVAESQYIFDQWHTALTRLSHYRHELMAGLAGSVPQEKTIKGHWCQQITKTYGDNIESPLAKTLDFKAVLELCRSLQVNCSKQIIETRFKQANATSSGHLSFDEFKDFYRLMKERPDIMRLYEQVTEKSAEGMTFFMFTSFLESQQGIDVTKEMWKWRQIFESLTKKPVVSEDPATNEVSLTYMDLEAFGEFLISPNNNILATIDAQNLKLDRRLNEYFVSSSHNTYLEGWQVVGKSSAEMYIRALERGCRCVEIDCWDGANGKPIVVHGRTMTSSVPFLDCIKVISKHAFDASPYPLILSLEVHCSSVQQQIMVDIMKTELGERLLLAPVNTTEELPSPEELKYKILVKVKKSRGSEPVSTPVTASTPAKSISSSMTTTRKRSISSPFSRSQSFEISAPHAPDAGLSTSFDPQDAKSLDAALLSSTQKAPIQDSEESDVPQSPGAPDNKPAKSKIIPSLGNLGVYTRGVKLEDFSNAESREYNHIFSLSETTFQNNCGNSFDKMRLEAHNTKYLMRVYPAMQRWSSSNFNPLTYWRRGVQMAALNWQTYDLGMQINDAMFADGADKYGYVLKPQDLRPGWSGSISDDAHSLSHKIQRKGVTVHIKVISAQQLPRPPNADSEKMPNPYVEIELFCAEDKSKLKDSTSTDAAKEANKELRSTFNPVVRKRTAIVRSNGYNPIFDEEFTLNVETKYPDLVFIRWRVFNSPDGEKYLSNNAQAKITYTAKLSSLQNGYRYVPLYDSNGDQYLLSTLFCQITKEKSVNIERNLPMMPRRSSSFKQKGQDFLRRHVSVKRKSSRNNEEPQDTKPH